jgi:hypothetical protein
MANSKKGNSIMNVQKEVAACLPEQAAGKNLSQDKSYRRPILLSNLKLRIGELLLFGDKQNRETWNLFEVLLTQHIEIKYLGGRP